MDIGSGDQTTDYSTNELNQYFLVTKEQDDQGAVSRHCSNMRYDLDGNLTEMWHVDATNTFRGGFVGDMTGPTADMTSEVASASMKRIVPMKMASEETGYESEELLFTEGSLAILLTPLGGGQVGTTLQPHTTYWITYTTDTSATDFVVVASAESAAQGLQAALAPHSGDWSDNTNFAYVDLESLFGSLDDSGDTRLVKTDIITNHLTNPAGTSGRLCRFTTGDAGELRLHVELIASDSQTNQVDLRTITLNLEVVDSVAQDNHDAHDNIVLAASGSSSKIANRDLSSAEISWPVEGDAAPQLLAWYTHDNRQEDSSALASLTSNTPSSISEDLLPSAPSIFAAPDFSLAMLASILGQTSVPNYDFNNDGDVDIRDYAALMLMGQSQEDQSLLLTWDTENRLIAVEPQIPVNGDTKVTFTYDYKGRRVFKYVYTHDGTDWNTTESSQTRYIYDGWKLIEEFCTPSGTSGGTGAPTSITTERQYTWGLDLYGSLENAGGIGGLLSVNDVVTETTNENQVVTGNDYIYFYDANGNVVQVIVVSDNSAPALAAHYEYSPYGERVNTFPDIIDQPFRFSTKAFDSETGFGYWGHRYYSPELGRWLSRDPIGTLGGETLYHYCYSNPGSYIDPNGDRPIPGGVPGTALLVNDVSQSNDGSSDDNAQYKNLMKKFEAICKKCYCKAGSACSKEKCIAEASAMAQAYVKMFNAMADYPQSPGGYGSTSRDNHRGWFCYHWKTHTYNAVSPHQGDCIKVAASANSTQTQDENGWWINNPKHNWVVVTVGKEAERSGGCTLRLDPWREGGPNAYSDSEHEGLCPGYGKPTYLGKPTGKCGPGENQMEGKFFNPDGSTTSPPWSDENWGGGYDGYGREIPRIYPYDPEKEY